MSELLNTKQLIEWLGVSENTIYNWRKKGKLPFIQLTTRTIKYDKDDIIKWLKTNGKDIK